MPYEREGKLLEGGRYLACHGLTLVPPYCAARIIGAEEQDLNIMTVSQELFPLLTGQAPPFEEALNWLQFAYTADRMGAYVVPASTFLV